MEHNTHQSQHGLLEDFILAPKGDSYWTTNFPSGGNEIFPSCWNSEPFDHNPNLASSNSSFSGIMISPALAEPESGFASFPFTGQVESYPFLDEFAVGSSFDDHCKYNLLPPIPIQGGYENGQLGISGQTSFPSLQDGKSFCKAENIGQTTANSDASAVVLCGEKKNKVKKIEGQPSKNLMAERRRRKRLNDRLSMLRSIVPKISKMDRTSILGDTIDYMKELLDKIHKLREGSMEENENQINVVGNFKELNPNEINVRNPPKFDVERRDLDTRIEICCTAKPGMLFSTVSTLEALGLDIQQCVISCFNDFSVQASCSEMEQHRRIIGSEDVKQALFRNAGYGGRCL